MREAVIVSTARTPIGKAYRGGFNNTASPTLAGHAVKAAVERAVQLSHDKYCSASAMLGKTAEITYSVDIQQA